MEGYKIQYMKQLQRKHIEFFPLLVLLCLMLAGCSGNSLPAIPSQPTNSNQTTGQVNSSPALPATEKETWNNQSQVLSPTAGGTIIYQCEVATVDATNTAEGYLMVNYTGTNEKVKLQITGPDGVTYTYNLHGSFETFPLTAGDGSYSVGIYESINIEENKYSTAFTQDISVQIDNTFGPYLYPNQYVNFTATSLAVEEARKLASDCSIDLDVVSNVYNYIIDNYTYDYDKAATVQSGYLPDVDEIFQVKTGICFDYAAIMATMLRSQGIPTRLEVGYKGEEYHAWISTYIQNMGWVNGIIEFDGKSWELMDPTFASTSNSPKDFISDNSDYFTRYVY